METANSANRVNNNGDDDNNNNKWYLQDNN
jgi:hypothetical protein